MHSVFFYVHADKNGVVSSPPIENGILTKFGCVLEASKKVDFFLKKKKNFFFDFFSIFSVFDALVPTTSALRLLPVPSAYFQRPVPTTGAQCPLSLPSTYFQRPVPTTGAHYHCLVPTTSA